MHPRKRVSTKGHWGVGWDVVEFPYLCIHYGCQKVSREEKTLTWSPPRWGWRIILWDTPSQGQGKEIGQMYSNQAQRSANFWEPDFSQGVWNASVHTEAEEEGRLDYLLRSKPLIRPCGWSLKLAGSVLTDQLRNWDLLSDRRWTSASSSSQPSVRPLKTILVHWYLHKVDVCKEEYYPWEIVISYTKTWKSMSPQKLLKRPCCLPEFFLFLFSIEGKDTETSEEWGRRGD